MLNRFVSLVSHAGRLYAITEHGRLYEIRHLDEYTQVQVIEILQLPTE